MTQLLEKALHEVSKLPPEKQEAIASVILEELEDDRRWDEAFAASQDIELVRNIRNRATILCQLSGGPCLGGTPQSPQGAFAGYPGGTGHTRKAVSQATSPSGF